MPLELLPGPADRSVPGLAVVEVTCDNTGMSWPAYLDLHESGELERRADVAAELLRSCELCPRSCGKDRNAGQLGQCRTGRLARIASFGAHHGEESCLRGRCGSGTIFFSGCSLGCLFCQNWELSHGRPGPEVDASGFAAIMLDLQARGCHNINLVTPSHVVPQILAALPRAVNQGLRVPLVYNTSAYDGLAALHLLEDVVDIYMPDFKYWSPHLAERFLTAGDYPEVARRSLTEMHRQVGDLTLDSRGLARRGLLVRHLVMPEGLAESEAVVGWLAALSRDTYLNVMTQYRPHGRVAREPWRYEPLGRPLTSREHAAALSVAHAAGLRRAESA
jgi:putative pyruvate formate lyase activating enzyme